MGLLSIAAKQAIADGARYAQFAEFLFVDGASEAPERYWSGTYAKDYDGETWQPTGGIATVTPIESSEDFRANGVTMELAGIPAASMREGSLGPDEYKDRPARWILAVMDSQDTVVWAKNMYFNIDVLTYAITSAGGQDTPIGVARATLEHEVTRAARINNRRSSHADQQSRYPGDLGFEHLAYLTSDAEIYWGSNGTTFK